MAKKKAVKRRTQVKDLPKEKKELSREEQERVKGGLSASQSSGGEYTLQYYNSFKYVPSTTSATPEVGEQEK